MSKMICPRAKSGECSVVTCPRFSPHEMGDDCVIPLSSDACPPCVRVDNIPLPPSHSTCIHTPPCDYDVAGRPSPEPCKRCEGTGALDGYPNGPDGLIETVECGRCHGSKIEPQILSRYAPVEDQPSMDEQIDIVLTRLENQEITYQDAYKLIMQSISQQPSKGAGQPMREKIAEIVNNIPHCSSAKCMTNRLDCYDCRQQTIDALVALFAAREQQFAERVIAYLKESTNYVSPDTEVKVHIHIRAMAKE